MERSKGTKRPRGETPTKLQLRKTQPTTTVTLTLEQLQKIVENAVEKKLKELMSPPHLETNSECSYIV